ncbi:hypothetical protein TcG_12909, partial [Trypanosoma cruzi]
VHAALSFTLLLGFVNLLFFCASLRECGPQIISVLRLSICMHLFYFLHPFLICFLCFGCSAALWVVCLNSLCPSCSDCENTLWVRVHGSVVAALFVVVALGQPRQDCQRVALGCLVELIPFSSAMDSRRRRTLSCRGVIATRWQFSCCCCFSCFVFPSGIVRCGCRMWRQ